MPQIHNDQIYLYIPMTLSEHESNRQQFHYRKRSNVNVQLDTRNVFLTALIALVVLASAFLALAPRALAAKSDCPPADVCVWAGPAFGGDRAFFAGSDTGCHALAAINPRSAFNHTGTRVAVFPGLTSLFPGESFSNLGSPFTGSLCIE